MALFLFFSFCWGGGGCVCSVRDPWYSQVYVRKHRRNRGVGLDDSSAVVTNTTGE